jgi:hypothetical protein
VVLQHLEVLWLEVVFNIGGGNFTVDSNGNVGVASSINLSAGGDLELMVQ